MNKKNILPMGGQEKFKSILNSIPKSVFATDREGTVVFNNDISERLLGIPEVQLLEKTISDIFLEMGQKILEILKEGLSLDRDPASWKRIVTSSLLSSQSSKNARSSAGWDYSKRYQRWKRTR